MAEYPLVSIITPCYNGQDYVRRYFDSILEQTYPNIELIFVNDGSTDSTGEIALSYKEKLEQRGIKYDYICQENKGVPGAINAGLPLFHGEYLTWPDSDDYMRPDCIEKKVEFLEEYPNAALVMCQIDVVNENNPDIVIGRLARQHIENSNVFDDLILENDIFFAPVGWMVRGDVFRAVNSSLHIYDQNDTGQNWQMLLPVSYKRECGFITESLGIYFIREGSHSRREKSYETLQEKTFRHQKMLEHPLSKCGRFL